MSTQASELTNEYRHISVLLDECITALNVSSGSVYVDATLGGAGHSCAIARLLGTDGMLIGIDQDTMALTAAGKKLETTLKDLEGMQPSIELLKGNFSEMDSLLASIPVPGVDAVLFDLGVSSPQLDFVSRGFSFKEDAPLDMRMDPNQTSITAADLLNTLSEEELARIIYQNSDEKWAKRIAHFIVEARARMPFERSAQLVDCIKAAIPASARRAGGHPAKRTFQALRIEVNHELEVLRTGLTAALRWLNPGGRVAVISYHSLEDRIVKELFARYSCGCTCPPDLPVCACGAHPVIKVHSRRAIVPRDEEIEQNPRARSAKLRVAEKLAEVYA